MPVYIRSGELDIPAPSISTLDSEDEDGVFLLDPELVVDELPQPFRMIDKILTGIVEDTWDVIVDRQVKREAELRRIKPPVYKPTSKIDEFSGSTCITHSGDERFLFVALEAGGLVAYDAATHEKVAEWLCPDVCVETMTCKPIGPQCYLLATVDDMGFARLVLMAFDTFHVVHIMNEQVEGNPKSNAVKFELSSSGDYCGLSLQSGGSAWVDFYKLPRDTWMREVDNAQKESLKRAQMSSESIDNNEVAVSASETFDVKFTPLTLVLKVKEVNKLAGCPTGGQQEAMEKAGITGTIGNGSGHLLSENHLRLRREVTKKLHDDVIQFHQEEEPSTPTATWHFLLPSRMQHDFSVPAPGFEATPVSVCIWWSGSNLLQTFPLGAKNIKDPELKPDIVWPMLAPITVTSMSDCSSIIGVGLEGGYVTLFDRHLCVTRAMINVTKNVTVRDINVIDGSLRGVPVKPTNPPPVYALIGLSNGDVYLLDSATTHCSRLVQKPPYAILSPLPGLPGLFINSSSLDAIQLRDTTTGSVVCEIDVTKSLMPMRNRILFSYAGDVIYVRDDVDVFSYSIRSFPSLDKYRGSKTAPHPLVHKESIADRCQRLLTERSAKQTSRNEVLSTRWRVMNKELGILVHLKSTLKTPPTASSSPMSRWNETTGKVLAHNRALTH